MTTLVTSRPECGTGLRLNRPRQSFGHLLGMALDALAFWPPDYVRAFLGPYRSWLPPFDAFSEFTMADPWRLGRALKYLFDVTMPSISAPPPPLLPPIVDDLLFAPTEILQRPDYYDSYTSYPEEHWFFINGIMTNGDMAQLNAACLTYLFHRPVTLIQNSTDGVVLDLFECSLGKEWFMNTESATVAFPPIYDALKDHHKKKVVVICHSQGTIIMAVVLRALKALAWSRSAAPAASLDLNLTGTGMMLPALGASGAPAYIFQDELPLDPRDFEPLTEEEWEKLEIYCFANCASEMCYQRPWGAGCQPLPWIESFGNEFDFVARLGMLAPDPAGQGIHLEGPFYLRSGAWGHLLNQCYLLPIIAAQKPGRKRGGTCEAWPFRLVNSEGYYQHLTTPRLFQYINGGSPTRRDHDEHD